MSSRWEVQIIRPQDGKPRTFSTHDNREAAEVEAAKLRRHGFWSQVRRVDDEEQVEQPEHRNERRRFLCWAVMCGFATPERMTERIVDEIEREAAS